MTLNTQNPTIAILGGTFDPIHNGHLHIAQSVLNALPHSLLWLMPNAVPPHRPLPLLDEHTRLMLCRESVFPLANIEVNDLELRLPRPSYTFHTLHYLQSHYPSAQFIWILGMDAWQHFHTWHRWQETLEKAAWLILERPNHALLEHHTNPLLQERWNQRQTIYPATPLSLQNGAIYTLPLTPHPASSTEIRAAYAEKNLARVNEWLPAAVESYLRISKLLKKEI